MDAKTILIGIFIGIIVGGALVYAVTPRYDPTAFQSQIEDLESSLSGLEDQKSDLQTQLSGLQDQISDLQTSLGARDTELTIVQDENYRYESAIETLNVEIGILSDENDALRQQLNSIPGTDEESHLPTYLYNVEIKEDWVIDDYQEINDTLVTVDGSIFIVGDGKLVIRDSYLNVTMDYHREHTIIVGEWGSDKSQELELYNVAIDTNGEWMYAEFLARSKIIYDKVWHTDPHLLQPYYNANGDVEITVIDSNLGITLGGNTTLRAENSDLFLEIYLINISGTYTLPTGEFEEQTFMFECGRETVLIETSGCTFLGWGTTLSSYTNITFVDTEIVIGMNAGLGTVVPEEKIVLSGLKAQRYDYFVVDYDTNHLELVNSTAIKWYPQVWGGTVLEISDSKIADLQWNRDDSVIIVRNSTVDVAFAMEEVTYYIYDSTILWDIMAADDSWIFLYNTEVGGKIIELGNGQVFIDDEPYGD